MRGRFGFQRGRATTMAAEGADANCTNILSETDG